jgi:hypothetical protein
MSLPVTKGAGVQYPQPMTRAIFTICDSHYSPKMLALHSSVMETNAGIDFIHVTPESTLFELNSNIISLSISDLNLSEEWIVTAEKNLDIVEISTAIKPHVFLKLFEMGYSEVMFLDPDIYVLGNLDYIFSICETSSIVLTPHRVTFNTTSDGFHTDLSFLRYGTFNLGFICISNSELGVNFANWWSERTLFDSRRARFLDVYTDQKWINLVPSFHDCYILRDHGVNVAPWNFDERGIVFKSGQYFTRSGAPYVFIHFSQQSNIVENKSLKGSSKWLTSDIPGANDELLILEQLIIRYNSLLAHFRKFQIHHPTGNKPRKIQSATLFHSNFLAGARQGLREDYERIRIKIRSRFYRLVKQ